MLKKHQRTHAGEEPFNCSICEKKFALLGHFKEHQRTHAGEELFTCLQCGKRFVLFSGLKEHKRIHIGEEPFSCTTCDKKFALLCNLKQHQRTHAGEKPFSQPNNIVDQQQSTQQKQPSQQQSPPSSPPFHGWTPSECKPDMNKQRYETDEEEFEDLNECFYEPPSRLVTPRKRPAEDDDGSGESRNCRPRYN